MNNDFNNNNMNNDYNNDMNNNDMNDNFNNMNNNNNMGNNFNDMNNGPMNNNQFQAYPPKKSNIGIVIGIIAALILIGGGLLAYFLLFKGDEVLKCSMSETESGITITADVEIKFKNGYISGGTMSEKVDGSSLTDEQMNTLKEYNMCSTVPRGNSSVSFSNCKQNVSGKTITVSVDIVPGDSVKDEKVDMSEGKEMFEKMGFTCK